jgi:hypothetical protein
MATRLLALRINDAVFPSIADFALGDLSNMGSDGRARVFWSKLSSRGKFRL